MGVLSRNHIFFCDELKEKTQVIKFLADQAVVLGVSDHARDLVAGFMEREAMGPTGIGEGIAVPHAKSASVREVSVLIIRSKEPILWESFDGQPVYLAIALLVPVENPDNIHLKILSAVTRKLVKEEFKKDLFAAETADQMMELFKELNIEGGQNNE